MYIAMVFTTLGGKDRLSRVFSNQVVKIYWQFDSNIKRILLFAAIHWSLSTPVLISIDLGFIYVDSVIYGVIFAKNM
jgi:hypothetical protein